MNEIKPCVAKSEETSSKNWDPTIRVGQIRPPEDAVGSKFRGAALEGMVLECLYSPGSSRMSSLLEGVLGFKAIFAQQLLNCIFV